MKTEQDIITEKWNKKSKDIVKTEMIMKLARFIVNVISLLILVGIATIIYVAYHFITKWW